MSARLVSVDGKPVDKKPGQDLQVFTFAIYRGHIAAAVDGQHKKPGLALIELANVISTMLNDDDARTAMVGACDNLPVGFAAMQGPDDIQGPR